MLQCNFLSLCIQPLHWKIATQCRFQLMLIYLYGSYGTVHDFLTKSSFLFNVLLSHQSASSYFISKRLVFSINAQKLYFRKSCIRKISRSEFIAAFVLCQFVLRQLIITDHDWWVMTVNSILKHLIVFLGCRLFRSHSL